MGGGYPPLRGPDPPGCQKVGEIKRFRYVVAKKFLDKHWIEWGFGGRRGNIPPGPKIFGTKSPSPRSQTLPTSGCSAM